MASPSFVSAKDERFIELACERAKLSPCHSQHGCILTRNGKVLSFGHNHFNTCSLSLSLHTLHAEVHAISNYSKRQKCKQSGKETISKSDIVRRQNWERGKFTEFCSLY
jgi:deoxycytidylate deaminase